jgi:plastocyanin
MQSLRKTKRRGSSGAIWAVAIVALILGLSSFGYAYIATSSGSNSGEVNSLSSSVASLSSELSGLHTVNMAPQTRTIWVTWQLNNGSVQDRFDPTTMVINQGDTVNIVFQDNDTGDAHTFTLYLPGASTPLIQLNDSAIGLDNFLNGGVFSQNPLNCYSNGSPTTCNTHGGIGNLKSTGSFTMTTPGVYRYYCVYHQSIGMFGFLLVEPNQGYHS